jgi:xylose import ATP-binding protein xylG
MDMTIMKLENITKQFPGVKALDNVNIEVNKGEILGIMGENGAGKSTLMQVISGKYPYGTYEGKIYINGAEQKFNNTRDSEKSGIGMIYQELNVHLDMSSLENVFLGDWILKGNVIDWNKMEQEFYGIMEMLNLNVKPHEKLRNLTNAEQQMICIGHALRKNPQILILDEPTAALPEKEVEILFSTIRKLKSRGITIILISHKMDEVFSLCDRLCVIRNGKTIATHDIHEVSLEQVVEEMIGHSIGTMYPKEEVKIGEELLRVEHLTIRHPFNYHKNILEDVSFTLHSGEILGLEGLVGSGRTELMRALYGQGDILTGDIYVKGKKMDIRSPKKAIQNGIVLITEERRSDGFIGMMSIKKNVSLSSLHKISRHNILRPILENKFVNEYMEKLRIKAPSAEVAVENLSGGNQQKVVISKCLLADPSILMMDEPTRGVDVGAKTEIYKIMNEQAKQGKGIIMTSSERAELLNMTDRMIVIGKSKVQGVLEHSEYDEKRIVALAAQ